MAKMLSQLIIHPDPQTRLEKILEILSSLDLAYPHPNVEIHQDNEKLGIENIRVMQEFLSLKPYQGSVQVAAIVSADDLSVEAQNSLLKSLEEPFENTLLILGATSESTLIPTIISRCQIIRLNTSFNDTLGGKNTDKFQTLSLKLRDENIEERFRIIEKLDDRDEFLKYFIRFCRNELINKLNTDSAHTQDYSKTMEDLLLAEVWQNQNVGSRAILEYLALRI